MIKFSIIVPIYNVEKYLRQCIESVLGQTYRNFELILVDDGSLDNCPSMCDEYAERDDRIIVIHQENKGLPAARNTGIKRAQGDYLMHLDGDDFWDANYLAKVQPIIEKDKRDIYLGNSRYDYTETSCRRVVLYPMEEAKGKTYSELLRLFFSGMNYMPSAICHNIYKTSFIKKNNFYLNEKLTWSEDADNFFRIFFATKNIGFFDYTFYYYRKDNQNAMTRNPRKEHLLSNIRVNKTWFYYVKNTNWDKKDKQIVMQRFANANMYLLKIMDKLKNIDYQIVADEIMKEKEMLKFIHGYIPKGIYLSSQVIGCRNTSRLINILKK